MFIYGLLDPISKELRYVGFTTLSIEIRLRHHLKPSELKRKTHKNHWLNELKRNNLKPEPFIIQDTNWDNWAFDEEWNIQYYRSIGCRLTNNAPGGGYPPIHRNPKNINMIKGWNKGKAWSQEFKNNSSARKKRLHKERPELGRQHGDKLMKFNKEKAEEIRQIINSGTMSMNKLCRIYNVSNTVIRNIKFRQHGY